MTEADAAACSEALPVARVLPMVQPAHLDRVFDYAVPPELSAGASPGVRVRVRFSGRLVDGYILGRTATTDHDGPLATIERVVSPLPVLTDGLEGLSGAVAERFAGTRAEVLRLAVPPRHARAEHAALEALGLSASGREEPGAEPSAWQEAPTCPREGWSRYTHGPAFLDAAEDGRAPRAVWQAMPGEDWARRIAEAAAATLSGGRSAVVLSPDRRGLDRVAGALTSLGLRSSTIVLAAGLGPQARYRRWVTALAGPPCIVVGNRSAVFTPVRRLGLLVVWDDGDDSHAEPRAPYPHAREVALLRAQACGAGALLGGFARTAEAQSLVGHGWAQDLVAPRAEARARSPLVRASGDSEQALARDPAARGARLPAIGFQAARDALGRDLPVLVQVPRAGYVPVVGCARCREPARCRRCAGPLELPAPPGDTAGAAAGAGSCDAAAAPVCRWCGAAARSHRCSRCGSRALRARVTGVERTAEEFGRAFSGVPVIGSSGDTVRDTVPGGASVVVATVGAEPVVDGGYGAALLLDGWSLLTRADLRAGEEALRRWMAASALVRCAEDGGRVVVVADSGSEVVQALIRWDPVGHARAELAQRRDVRFPPAVRLAAVDGAPDALAAFMGLLEAPASVEELGPVPLPSGIRLPGSGDAGGWATGPRSDLHPDAATADGAGGHGESAGGAQRMLLRVARRDGPALSRALRLARAGFSARRAGGPVRVQVDPVRVG